MDETRRQHIGWQQRGQLPAQEHIVDGMDGLIIGHEMGGFKTNGGRLDVRKSDERLLYLCWIDAVATMFQQPVLAPDELQFAIVVPTDKVACGI